MDDDLTELLATGERAAFHGRPSAGVAPLQRAVELAHARGHDAEATAAAWLLGVCLGAAGRYGARHAGPRAARDLVARGARPPPVRVPRRGHAGQRLPPARPSRRGPADRPARARARRRRPGGRVRRACSASPPTRSGSATSPTPTPRWPRPCASPTAAATGGASGSGSTGSAPRSRCCASTPTRRCPRATSAVTLAEASGAPRHVAKGLLFVGVSQVQAGDHEEAASSLRRAATLAESLGCIPLVWPARAVLGALVAPDLARRERARRSRRRVPWCSRSPTTSLARSPRTGSPGPTSPRCSPTDGGGQGSGVRRRLGRTGTDLGLRSGAEDAEHLTVRRRGSGVNRPREDVRHTMTTVLVCDDAPLAREAIRRAVGAVPGVERVTAAGSGEEVLARFPIERPDLVLMDVRMPGIGGVEALASARRRAPRRHRRHAHHGRGPRRRRPRRLRRCPWLCRQGRLARGGRGHRRARPRRRS